MKKNISDKNIIYSSDDIIVFKDEPQRNTWAGCYDGLTVKEIEERENREVLEILTQVITYKRIYKAEKKGDESEKNTK